MKVLIVTKNTDPRSGIGRYSAGILRNIERSVNEVDIVSEDSKHGLKRKFTFLNFIRNCLATRRVAKQYDIVHALDGWPYGIYALFAVLGTNKKLFVGGVGTYSIPPSIQSIKRTLMLMMYRRVSGIFSISRYTEKRIQARVPFKIPSHVVHLASDLLPQVGKIDPYARFGLEEKQIPIFLTVGAVKERKGQLDSLIGLSLLKENYPNFLYLIVGDQRDQRYISLIKKTVQELGITSNVKLVDDAYSDEDLAMLYSISDIHLLNSNNEGEHFEGFGLVFLEANQFGVPGIGSKDCGIEDAIRDGVSGILVSQKDHQGIAKAVQTILKTKLKFEKGALEWHTHFSWMKTVIAYKELYESST